MKIKKKKKILRVGSGSRVGLGSQGECERRSEAFVKIQEKVLKKNFFLGGGGSGWVWRGQGGCE